MAWLRTRTWHWFVLALAMFLAAVLVLHGVVQSVDGVVAVFVFLGASIRAAGLGVRGNPVSAEMLRRRTGAGAWASWMAEESRGKRSGRGSRDR